MLQQALGHRPAAVQRADQVFLGHLHIGEEGFAERRGAGDQADRANLDARLMHREDHEGDALVLLGGVGAHQAEDHVRPLAAGGPDLLAVDQPVIALVLGPGRERGEVGAGARLGEALAPAHLPGDDVGNVLLLLILGAVFQQGRAEHAHAHAADRVPGADGGHFLIQHPGFLGREAAAAVLGRPGGDAPALFAHPLAPHRHVAGEFGAAGHGPRLGFGIMGQRLGEIGFKPFARLRPETVQIGAAKVSHEYSP